MRISAGKEYDLHIIMYDISDDKERASVVKCLEQYCQRLQKSVWAGEFSRQTLKTLRTRLENLEIKTGMVDIWEGKNPQRIGTGSPFPERCSCHVA